jgi:CheY-like chemotaxis protein
MQQLFKLQSKKVLIADDNPDSRRLFQRFLGFFCRHVEFAENGTQAIEMAKAKNFDFILMDLQMPVLDGVHATQALRAEGYTGAIFAVTAHDLFHEREKFLDHGFDDFIAKPVDRLDLLFRLAGLSQAQGSHPVTNATWSPHDRAVSTKSDSHAN